jgi:hypothetical protein
VIPPSRFLTLPASLLCPFLLQVVRHLVAAGHDVHVVTAAPEFVFTTEITSPSLHIRKVLLDCGAVQADALTVDRLASLEKVSGSALQFARTTRSFQFHFRYSTACLASPKF